MPVSATSIRAVSPDRGNASVTLPPIYFEADRDLIHQALTNLVENAIKYTLGGGKIKVTIQTRQGIIVFSIQDPGIGIAPLDMPHIFEKFYRVRRFCEEIPGAGIGLAIVKHLVELQGGSITVRSQENIGTRFSVRFPRSNSSSSIV